MQQSEFYTSIQTNKFNISFCGTSTKRKALATKWVLLILFLLLIVYDVSNLLNLNKIQYESGWRTNPCGNTMHVGVKLFYIGHIMCDSVKTIHKYLQCLWF